MEGLLNLNRSKSSGYVKGNIDKFESLSVQDSQEKARPGSAKSKRSILEITSNASTSDDTSTRESVDLQISEQQSKAGSSQTTLVTEAPASKQKKRESVAFIQKSYLDRQSHESTDTLPEDAREILKSQPDYEDLLAVLQYLECGIQGKHDFNIHVTGPKAAQIINALVTVTVPDHWPVLRIHKLPKRHEQVKNLIVLNLRSVAGIGALLMHVRKLSVGKKQDTSILEDTLSVLQLVLHGNQFLKKMLKDIRALYQKETQRRLNWQEMVSLVAGSKIMAFVAQAVSAGGVSSGRNKWLSEGNDYCKWLAKNISEILVQMGPQDSEAWAMIIQVVKRALNLGYRDAFVSELYHSLLLGKQALWTPIRQLLHHLSIQEQRLFFDAMLRDLVRKYLRHGPATNTSQKNGLENESNIGGVAAMVAGMTQNNTMLEDHMVQWLTSTTGEYASLGLDTRRAVIATLALREDKLQTILEKCLENFGDKLQILHSPILQQESMAEVLLLTIGYVHRLKPDIIKQTSKSGTFLHTISNRLAASVPRARLLGMIVATAVSRLVDGPEKAMDFGVEELEEPHAQRWFNLIHIKDETTTVDSLRQQHQQETTEPAEPAEPTVIEISAPKKPRKPAPQQSKIISIEEVESDIDSESEDSDLVPYAKPDEDPEDSDEDPTLINRNKPNAPVYIIDLIKQLQSDDKPDTVELALITAPSLIRRKATFGTEVSDNVQAIAYALLNIKSEVLDSDELHHLRQQGLIASLIAQPKVIAPWLASMYFEGDYSLDQRASILSTLGLGARELAGLDPTPSSSSPTSALASTSTAATLRRANSDTRFPSSRLPPSLASYYTSSSPSPTSPPPTTPHATLESTATTLTHTLLRPLALSAADKLSGPDALKIRTFSSRLAVEQRRKDAALERSKRIPKDLHRLIAESFFVPLCDRLALVVGAGGAGRGSMGMGLRGTGTLLDPNLLRLSLQTLTILLHALGPNAQMQLGEVSREALVLVNVLLGAGGGVVVRDPVVLPAVLHLVLGVLEVNVEAGGACEERLVGELGAEVAVVVRWVGGLMEGGAGQGALPVVEGAGDGGGMGGGSGGLGGMGWDVLAAGIRVRWAEIGRRWQGRVLGLGGVEGWD